MPSPELLLAAIVAALLVGGAAGAGWWAAAREARRGRLVAVDTRGTPGPLLRSERWRISGRPDEIRALADSTWIPVEWKSRPAPVRGPLPSHRMQLLAYCLLCEARTGKAPPYGILRYGDGREFRIAWDREARDELFDLRRAMDRPYDGRHLGSVAKCRGCRWRSICDRRVDG